MEIPGYEIERQIGQGGMASAYLAVQTSLDRQVVLKILDTRAHVSAETLERFLNEGRIIASLNHPHIITIYDVGRADERAFISMEYIEGGDLKQRIAERAFTPDECLAIVEKIASGLAAAHDAGIIHRDVKPGNILFRRDGTPILSDFGIAKRLGGDSDLTITGMFLGSPNYMAPEQSEAGPIDGRADLYSLGVILFEMLTGTRAYPAESIIDVILLHKQAPVPRLPPALADYQELLNLLMAKDRNSRFRDARSLIHFIAELRRRALTGASAPGAKTPVPRPTAPEIGTVTVTRLRVEPRRPLWRRLVLPLLLVVCSAGWGGLLYVEHELETRAEHPAQTAAVLEVLPAGPPPQAPAVDPDMTQVAEALLWLGRRSLDEFRLTAPPRDNAYYYFSRLLQMSPEHVGAREGLREIAARYAILAEHELAQDHYALAQSYIAIGLKLDPQNDALHVLESLATTNKADLWATLKSLVR